MTRKIHILLCTSILFVAACGEPHQNADQGSTSRQTAPDGKALYMTYCSSCHNPVKDATGPATIDAITRWGHDTTKLYAFIRNSTESIKTSGDNSYPAQLYNKWGKITMPSFPSLTDAQISAILAYGTQRQF